MSKSEQLKAFILDGLDKLQLNSAGYIHYDPPNYELYARDYLEFAEQGLGNDNPSSFICCVGNLKRALECQIDMFFHIFNLLKLFDNRNLGLEQKLEFLSLAGILSKRSLVRLNTLRNRMEHKYEIPKIEDIQVYFDLVSSVIYTLELVPALSMEYELDTGETISSSKIAFSISYQRDTPSIQASWSDISLIVMAGKKATKEELEEFAFFFKVLVLISQQLPRGVVSNKYVVSRLQR